MTGFTCLSMAVIITPQVTCQLTPVSLKTATKTENIKKYWSRTEWKKKSQIQQKKSQKCHGCVHVLIRCCIHKYGREKSPELWLPKPNVCAKSQSRHLFKVGRKSLKAFLRCLNVKDGPDRRTDRQTAGKHTASGPGDRSRGDTVLWNDLASVQCGSWRKYGTCFGDTEDTVRTIGQTAELNCRTAGWS